MLDSLFNKLAVLGFIKKRLQNSCFPVNIVKILKTAFFIEHPWWLLLPKLETLTKGIDSWFKKIPNFNRNISILFNLESNYDKAKAALVTDFGVPYDYQSIMYYRKWVSFRS